MHEKDRASGTVLITGAAGGLGRALVRVFAGNGYRVIATDIGYEKAPLPEEIPGVLYRALDVTVPEQAATLRDETDIDQTGLDVLICAAGIYDAYPLTEADPVLFRKMMDVNLHGVVIMIQGMLSPLMINKGRVIVISSESHRIQALFQPYMVSKASLEAYCRVARQELALKGVSLAVIRPGAIRTPLLHWMDSPPDQHRFPVFGRELTQSWQQSLRMVGRISNPETVANKVFKAATTDQPKRIYRVNHNPLLKLVALLPVPLFERLTVRLFRKR